MHSGWQGTTQGWHPILSRCRGFSPFIWPLRTAAAESRTMFRMEAFGFGWTILHRVTADNDDSHCLYVYDSCCWLLHGRWDNCVCQALWVQQQLYMCCVLDFLCHLIRFFYPIITLRCNHRQQFALLGFPVHPCMWLQNGYTLTFSLVVLPSLYSSDLDNGWGPSMGRVWKFALCTMLSKQMWLNFSVTVKEGNVEWHSPHTVAVAQPPINKYGCSH